MQVVEQNIGINRNVCLDETLKVNPNFAYSARSVPRVLLPYRHHARQPSLSSIHYSKHI